MRCWKGSHSRWYLPVLMLGLLLPALPAGALTHIKLSGPLPLFGDVRSFLISPDGRYAVYLADQDTDEVFELYSVALSGGSPVRLNPLLPQGRNVESFLISPKENRVIYLADQDADEVFELYSVPIAGPAASGFKLNRPLVMNGDVQSFKITPNGNRVVYLADQDTDEVFELFSVPPEGPAAVGSKLNGPLVGNGDVLSFEISPDSARVVYRADQEQDAVLGLFSVSVFGPSGSDVRLNPPLVVNGGVGNFQISPDGAWVVYRADQDIENVLELYSVPIGGPETAAMKISGALVANGDVSEYKISPDSARVVYRADKDTDGVTELYSVPIRGPVALGVKLNGALVLNGNVHAFQISTDSSRVIYVADEQTFEVGELYSVAIQGPAAAVVKLNGPLTVGGNVLAFLISPDSRRVVYVADQERDQIPELYSVPIAGPANTGIKLNGALVAAGGRVRGFFQISPDSRRVAYLADQERIGVMELYSVPIEGPSTSGIKLNAPFTGDGSVYFSFSDPCCDFTPDWKNVLYLAFLNDDRVVDLYRASFHLLQLPLIIK